MRADLMDERSRSSSSTRRVPSRSATGLSPKPNAPSRHSRRSDSLTSGHRACQGCGEALGARYAIDAAMRATNGKLMVVNSTGCLEVFTTPYPETAWQMPWLHSLFGNAASVATGVAAAMRVKGATDPLVAQGGDGGTTDIGFGCSLRYVRAQRRRALHLLRQRRLHEHRRPTIVARRRPPPARPQRPSRRRPAMFRHRKKRSEIARRTRSLRRHGQRRQSARLERRSPRRWASTAPLHPYQRPLPARLGRRGAATRYGWPVSQSRPNSFRFRGRSRTHPHRAKSGAGADYGLPEAAAALRPPLQAGWRPRIAVLKLVADRNIADYGLLGPDWKSSNGAPIRDNPRRGYEPAQPHRLVAHRRPVYVDRFPPCNTPVRRAKISRAGSPMRKPATTRAWRALTADNPLPAIMGRVCYHPCETACNRDHDRRGGRHQCRRAVPRR